MKIIPVRSEIVQLNRGKHDLARLFNDLIARLTSENKKLLRSMLLAATKKNVIFLVSYVYEDTSK